MEEPVRAESIQQEMQAVRGHLDRDVGRLMQDARLMVDWRQYVKTYPWLAVGVAVALGFLGAPRRSKPPRFDAEALAELARQDRLVVHVDGKGRDQGGGGMGATLVSLVLAAATRGATAWATRQMGQLAETWTAEGQRQPESARQNR